MTAAEFVSSVEQAIVIAAPYIDGASTDVLPDADVREAANLLFDGDTEARLEDVAEVSDPALARRAAYARAYIIGAERDDERDNRINRLACGQTSEEAS